jgi:hypothetical protein
MFPGTHPPTNLPRKNCPFLLHQVPIKLAKHTRSSLQSASKFYVMVAKHTRSSLQSASKFCVMVAKHTRSSFQSASKIYVMVSSIHLITQFTSFPPPPTSQHQAPSTVRSNLLSTPASRPQAPCLARRHQLAYHPRNESPTYRTSSITAYI